MALKFLHIQRMSHTSHQTSISQSSEALAENAPISTHFLKNFNVPLPTGIFIFLSAVALAENVHTKLLLTFILSIQFQIISGTASDVCTITQTVACSFSHNGRTNVILFVPLS
mgnify:CR=1 FL=1